MTSGPLEIYLLGDFQIRIGERVIPDAAWKLRKAAGIVKLLALEPGHRLHREQILDTLWPELGPDAAANNLRVALYAARRILDVDGIPLREGQHLTLGPVNNVWTDVGAFETALDRAWRDDDLTAFQAAIDLYAGDLLPDDRYEDWLDARRTSLRTSFLAALAQMARLYQHRANTTAAITAWQRMLEIEPVQEEAHVQLMLLHAQAGRKHEALELYERLAAALDGELGIEPDSVSRELADAIRNGRIAAATPSVADSSRTRPGTHLPAPATVLIGRERELAEVQQLLASTRLVTITGPGGAGKTRLAIELARQPDGSFPDGVYVVSLAPLRDADIVWLVISQALGLADPGGHSALESISAFLRERSVLLVLDNFEHVASAAPRIASLLENCPLLKILVTSRVPLRVRGEQEYPLRSLPDNDSVALLIERSRAVRPDFNASDGQLPTLVQICRRLDGLPLAIELAAARSRVLSPESLLKRLEHPLAVLTSGPRDLPDRQQTLRATIAWSYDLLTPDIQRLFRMLAVFAGTWTIEAAEAIALDEMDAMDGVALLAENSLVLQHNQDDELRFRMLETIRQFALEQLELTGELDDARQRHTRYFLSLALQAAPEFRGPDSTSWQVRLAAEHDNLRAALAWALEHDPNRALHVAVQLEKYWFTRGSFTEWDYWLSAALERSTDADPHDRARALHQIAFTALNRDDLERSRAATEESLRIAQALDMQEALGRAKTNLAYLEERRGDLRAASALAHEALGHYRRSGNPIAIAAELNIIAGFEYSSGNYERAATMMEEALESLRATGDPFFLAISLLNLSVVLHRCGRVDEALQRLEEAMRLAQSINAASVISGVLVVRGQIALDQERYDLAHQLFIEGIEETNHIGATGRLLNALKGGAAVLAVKGNPVMAARAFAATERLSKTLNAPDPDHFQPLYDHHQDLCRSLVDPTAWTEAWERGSRLSLSEAVQLVMDELKALQSEQQDVDA